MSRSLRRAALVAALPLILFYSLATGSDARAESAAAAPCSAKSYSYAGLVGVRRAFGVKATLTALARPRVVHGQVAAWIGVGGVNAGLHGEAAWIQVGLSAFADGRQHLYLEVTRPGHGRTYTVVVNEPAVGEKHDVAVIELKGQPNWWQAWVDGRPVGDPVELPGSHGRWEPMATSESWNGGTGICNHFVYAFSNVKAAGQPGGGWRSLAEPYVLADRGFAVTKRTSDGFVARSV